MKQSTEDYLTGATLAATVIALFVSGSILLSGDLPIEKSEWVKDGVLETRTVKLRTTKGIITLPPEKFQPSRINWEVVQ